MPIPTFDLALRDLISPHAHASLSVVSESGTALVLGGFSVPAVPESVALLLVGENTVQPRTVGRAYGRLELAALAAIDVVQVVAVFREELAVRRVERQTVAARLQFGGVVVALPVLVARLVVRIETVVVWAFEVFL